MCLDYCFISDCIEPRRLFRDWLSFVRFSIVRTRSEKVDLKSSMVDCMESTFWSTWSFKSFFIEHLRSFVFMSSLYSTCLLSIKSKQLSTLADFSDRAVCTHHVFLRYRFECVDSFGVCVASVWGGVWPANIIVRFVMCLHMGLLCMLVCVFASLRRACIC